MDDKDREYRAGPSAIADWTDRLTQKPLGKRGFVTASLITQWAAIVGPALAPGSLPLKIVFKAGERSDGCLHLRIASGALALEIQHLEPLILQRINSHFGYRAVSRIALSQGVVPMRRPPPRPAPLDPDVEQRWAAPCESVSDPDLRAALTALGRRLAARR